MKLVMTSNREDSEKRALYAEAVGGRLSDVNIDGLSTQELREVLLSEQRRENFAVGGEEIVFVSADSRLLIGAQVIFGFESIFIADLFAVREIRGCTKRTLRAGHNLAKLFDANEFLVGV